jgi:predicted nucleotidyltransferase
VYETTLGEFLPESPVVKTVVYIHQITETMRTHKITCDRDLLSFLVQLYPEEAEAILKTQSVR